MKVTDNAANRGSGPQLWERIVTLSTAVFIIVTVIFLLVRNEPFRDPNLVVLARIILSLATALLGAVLPGFIHVDLRLRGLIIRATGAFALFVLTLYGTPAVLPNLNLGLDQLTPRFDKLVNSLDEIRKILEAKNMPDSEKEKIIVLFNKGDKLKDEWHSLRNQYTENEHASHGLSSTFSKEKTQVEMAEIMNDLEETIDGLTTLAKDLPSVSPPPSKPATFPVGLESIARPFILTNDYIYQPIETGEANGGRAIFNFTIPDAGYYAIQAVVDAPNTEANSFYVNIDSQPQDPIMIWDIPVTSGFERRIVSWRNNGMPTEFPSGQELFNLSQGKHQLVIVGRAANTKLKVINLCIIQAPPTPHLRVIGTVPE